MYMNPVVCMLMYADCLLTFQPTAPADIIDPLQDPQVVPQPVEDPVTGDDGITDTSATVMFTLPAEIEMNGPVDMYVIEVMWIVVM